MLLLKIWYNSVSTDTIENAQKNRKKIAIKINLSFGGSNVEDMNEWRWCCLCVIRPFEFSLKSVDTFKYFLPLC